MDQGVFYTAEVAEILSVKPVTIRAWAAKFEERGYTYLRDDKGYYAFRDSDINAFRHYQSLVHSKSMSQDSAIDVVVSRHRKGSQDKISSQSSTPAIIQTSKNEEILQYQKQFEEFIGRTLKVIENQTDLTQRIDEVQAGQKQQNELLQQFGVMLKSVDKFIALQSEELKKSQAERLELKQELEELRQTIKQTASAQDKRVDERDRKLMETLREIRQLNEQIQAQQQQKKRWWQRG